MKRKALIVKDKLNPKLFCYVEFGDTKITLSLYKHTRWFIFGVDTQVGKELDIQLIKVDPNYVFRFAPQIMHYEYGGKLEIWPEDLFDLEKRIEEIFEKYHEQEEIRISLQNKLNETYETFHTRQV